MSSFHHLSIFLPSVLRTSSLVTFFLPSNLCFLYLFFLMSFLFPLFLSFCCSLLFAVSYSHTLHSFSHCLSFYDFISFSFLLSSTFSLCSLSSFHSSVILFLSIPINICIVYHVICCEGLSNIEMLVWNLDLED